MPPPAPRRDDPLATSGHSLPLWEGDHEKLAKIHFKILKGHSDAVTSCHFCFEDTKVISASYDSTVKLWDIASSVSVQTFKDKHTGPISECCLSPDNKRLITASYDKTLKAWDTETGKMLWSVEQDGLLTSCHISHDGKYAVSGSDMENALLICSAEDAKQVTFLREYHRSTVKRCRFDPHNQRVATVSSDMSIKFWDIIAQSTTITIERAHNNAIADCCFSLDGHFLCTAGWDENIKLWDIRTGEFRSHGPITLEQGHIGIVGCCDISKDASVLVSGGYDKTIVIWDTQEAYKKLSLKGHGDWVTDIAISTDKKRLVSSSKDCTLRVWDIGNANAIPMVIQTIKTRGSKLAKCEECEKSFLIFQNDENEVESKCVFCRLSTRSTTILPVPPPLPPDL
ncbi:WD repeat-containing protein 88 [Varanus komodoensis]|uniref:WD repeat-containing protein 88 n=1 Tax=Varanus komodoensis TaxID=61221 RepID=UPI001CF7CCFC|nr:WD repeat-containing protein 88 [Varanus komodoensis]KAF7244627.1 WD repeat-containing protein 88 [Varanus komodoensis]